MKNLLVISSSPNLSASISKELIDYFADALSGGRRDISVRQRDLGKTPPPHLTEKTYSSFYTPTDQLSADLKDVIALSDELVAELLDADTIIIGAPMYNFNITSQLKTYLDHVARVGVTFGYGENGPEGKLNGRRVYVVVTRGGLYSKGSAAHMDNQEPYLRTMFGFLGLDDVTFIFAEELTLGEEIKAKSIDAAKSRLATIAQKMAA
ncbi:MAG: NAD(P)H-dependent oxidoreductase [Sneathiella sp.]